MQIYAPLPHPFSSSSGIFAPPSPQFGWEQVIAGVDLLQGRREAIAGRVKGEGLMMKLAIEVLGRINNGDDGRNLEIDCDGSVGLDFVRG